MHTPSGWFVLFSWSRASGREKCERKWERERRERRKREEQKKGKRENGKEVGTLTTLAGSLEYTVQFSPVLQWVATSSVLANSIAYLLCFLFVSGASFVSDIRCCYCALKSWKLLICVFSALQLKARLISEIVERRIETSRSLFRIPTVLCLHANTLKVRFVLIYCEFKNRFFCCCCWNLENPSACSFHTTRTSHKCLIAFNSDHNRKRNGTGIRVEESYLIETDNSCWWWKQRSCDLFIFLVLKKQMSVRPTRTLKMGTERNCVCRDLTWPRWKEVICSLSTICNHFNVNEVV